MKKLFIIAMVFALALTACDAMATAPTEAPVVQPTAVPPTPEVIVVTVEVPVQVTVEVPPAAPTPVPADTQPPAPAPTEVPPTAAAPAESAPSGGPIAVDQSFWGGSFKDIAYSNASFSLRCQPKEITITATAADPYIVDVDFYYRIEDRQGTYITEWKNAGRMKATGNSNFSMVFSGESIHPDLRKALAWFDFQLVGVNKIGDVVGRTEKIVQLVTYTIDCQP